MSKKQPPSSAGIDDHGYEVGYGKPPRHSQFRPGHSGNPSGRRKGVRNLATDVKRTLSATIKVKEGGHTRTRSTQEGVLMVLREKALRGDARALDRLIDLAGRFNNAGDTAPTEPLGADDRAILDDYWASLNGRPSAASPDVDPESQSGGGPENPADGDRCNPKNGDPQGPSDNFADPSGRDRKKKGRT